MPKIEAYEQYADEYDAWFERNWFTYQSELKAVRTLLPSGIGVEIGVGTGRFAQPLEIKIGVEPSCSMGAIAQKRGITVIDGVAEALPFPDGHLDFALMVTTICFLDDVEKAFKEAYRVLKWGGSLIVGFIDKNSLLGRTYEGRKNTSMFYKDATFYTAEQVAGFLNQAGFSNLAFVQTIYPELQTVEKIQSFKQGYGEGSFVVVKSKK